MTHGRRSLAEPRPVLHAVPVGVAAAEPHPQGTRERRLDRAGVGAGVRCGVAAPGAAAPRPGSKWPEQRRSVRGEPGARRLSSRRGGPPPSRTAGSAAFGDRPSRPGCSRPGSRAARAARRERPRPAARPRRRRCSRPPTRRQPGRPRPRRGCEVSRPTRWVSRCRASTSRPSSSSACTAAASRSRERPPSTTQVAAAVGGCRRPAGGRRTPRGTGEQRHVHRPAGPRVGVPPLLDRRRPPGRTPPPGATAVGRRAAGPRRTPAPVPAPGSREAPMKVLVTRRRPVGQVVPCRSLLRGPAHGGVHRARPGVRRRRTGRDRIDAHRARRTASWTTVETHDLAASLATDDPVLVDCLGTWLTAAVDDAGLWEAPAGAVLEIVEEQVAAALDVLGDDVVLVTNEVASLAWCPSTGPAGSSGTCSGRSTSGSRPRATRCTWSSPAGSSPFRPTTTPAAWRPPH